MICDSYEEYSEIKLKVEESILHEWELWKLADNQNENKSRSEAFENLKNCGEELYLGFMYLSTLPNTFPYGLKILNLKENHLTQIPDYLPETLQILNMENNLVCTIPKNLPSNLRELIMVRNKITSIPDTLPDSITLLNFYQNQICTLPNKLPKGLKIFNVCGNNLSCLPENLPESLEELKVKRNCLTTLPKTLPKSLRSIIADNNDITNLPETLPDMLNEINIGSNKLVSLPERLPKSLQKLNLSNNFLTNPKLNSESIIELNMENNGIVTILEEYFKLPNLQKLFVSKNKLTSLPRNLPETLERLIVSNNNLSVFPDDLPKSLKYLILEQNNITTVAQTLPPQLKALVLDFNKLTEIPMELPQSLEKLSLSNNLITEVSSKIENFPNITLYLYENSLNGSSLDYLRQLIRTTNEPVVWFDDEEEYYETLPLIEEITNWLDAESIHPYWNTISEQVISRPFSHFLSRIRQTRNFEIEQFKKDMAKWLRALGEESNFMQKLRKKVFLVAAEATESCDNRVAWSLNQMKILTIVGDVELGKYDHNIVELVKLARGMYRLNILEQISRKMVYETGSDEIDVYFAYQVQLRDVLELPIDELEMDESYPFFISHEDLESAINEIITNERIEFVDYLLIDWQPWKEVLKRWNYDRFIQCKSDIQNEEVFNQSLDKRKQEYLLETEMPGELLLDVEIVLARQVQRQIEKDMWLKLTNEFLESIDLQLESI